MFTEQDRIPQPHDFIIKLFNVHGKMFDSGAVYPTQDIEFNSIPILEFAGTKTNCEIVDLRTKYGNDQSELCKRLEARKNTDLQKGYDAVRNMHIKSRRQYSQAAYRFSEFVIKYCSASSAETQRKLYEETVKLIRIYCTAG
ncbi:hypothetical protein DIS24_g6042 [Lasiodiplodia hormozganensis]|uniref:Uncharacterized protein n=1 Tax=Lasiodiplodia hormozganensis TaxID=869390 RepID=A0AA39YK58_9PEZI|nr:hypothetical protein DIS24_g6042 [Lasiodiplodia hormozganensis]